MIRSHHPTAIEVVVRTVALAMGFLVLADVGAGKPLAPTLAAQAHLVVRIVTSFSADMLAAYAHPTRTSD